jgi:hypothetical protein
MYEKMHVRQTILRQYVLEDTGKARKERNTMHFGAVALHAGKQFYALKERLRKIGAKIIFWTIRYDFGAFW